MPGSSDTPGKYIFNHIPKSGGTSLLAVCRRNLHDSDISPHLWEHDVRMTRIEPLEHYRLVRGHFSLLSQARFVRDRYSITLLRHPIRTIVSAYQFARKYTGPADDAVTVAAQSLSFDEYVRHFGGSPAVIRNRYTHHFAAIPNEYPGSPEDGAALLAAARHNLATFDFVGITEEFDDSVSLLCRSLGWPAPADSPRENVSGSEELFARLAPDTRRLLMDANDLDLKLYELGRNILQGFAARVSGEGRPERKSIIPFPLPYQHRADANILEVRAAYLPGSRAGTLHIVIEFSVAQSIDDLVAGVQIRDSEGNVVFGTNTAREKQQLHSAADCRSHATFVLECSVTPGAYFVTVALTDARRIGYHYHWIDHATSFTVPPEGKSQDYAGMRCIRFHSTPRPDR